MTGIGKAMLAGLALATASLGVATPAQARTYVEIGIGSGGYYDPYYREGYRYRDWDRERWHRHHHRDWRRDRYWRGDRYWRYRDRCWTEWGWTRWGERVPVRVCR